MALTVTGFSSSNLAYKLAKETDASDTASLDIFGGGGTLHSLRIDNTSQSNAAFLKMKITAGTVTVGTTEPDLMFHLAAAQDASHANRSVAQIEFPSGLRFSQMSFWVTDAAATSDQGDPGTVTVTILAS